MGGSHPLPVSLILSPQPFGPFFIPISFVPLLYHTLRGLSRGFLHFFSWLFPVCVVVLRFLLTVEGTFPKLGTHSFLLTSLLYHNLGDLSRGFSNFFEKSFRLALSHSYQCLGVCGLLPSPLDTLIVSQLG